ncbi:hypothetical protein [Alsobacter soli]|uniref:hypothetical protein n=1 Tax=Alsobacter soli TaxID=2109933 RepID=UPI0013047F6A|nr:hypothetical protein [Alsobacter soli]
MTSLYPAALAAFAGPLVTMTLVLIVARAWDRTAPQAIPVRVSRRRPNGGAPR